MAELLYKVAMVLFILGGAFLLLTLFLGIRFKVWEIIGDLSGRTARKSIASIRIKNEQTGVKTYKDSNKLAMNHQKSNEFIETGVLSNAVVQHEENETTLLYREAVSTQKDEETTLLSNKIRIGEVEDRKITIHMINDTMFVHTEEIINNY